MRIGGVSESQPLRTCPTRSVAWCCIVVLVATSCVHRNTSSNSKYISGVMADMTFGEITESGDFWELHWEDFQLNPVGDGDSKTPTDKEAEYLTSRFEPITDYPSQCLSYGQETHDYYHHKSLHISQDGILRGAKRRRLLFCEQAAVNLQGTEIPMDSSGRDLHFLHSMPDQTLWPMLTTSVEFGDCSRDKLAEAELSKWISDILPDDHLDDKMVGVESESNPHIQTPSYLSTVDKDLQLTDGKVDTVMAEDLGPRTPDPFLGRTSTTELQQVEMSRQFSTSCQENTSASSMSCQPFSILKPEGGFSLQSINEALKKPSLRLAPCSPMGADHGLCTRTSSTRDLGVSLSGKPIVTRTKIITEGTGTLTILRTAN